MAHRWFGLTKAMEESAEFIVEAAKLDEFPQGRHPGRKRNLVVSLEEEVADVIGAMNYLIDRNGLNRKRIERRAKNKYKKFSGWWGVPQLVKETVRKIKKTPKGKK